MHSAPQITYVFSFLWTITVYTWLIFTDMPYQLNAWHTWHNRICFTLRKLTKITPKDKTYTGIILYRTLWRSVYRCIRKIIDDNRIEPLRKQYLCMVKNTWIFVCNWLVIPLKVLKCEMTDQPFSMHAYYSYTCGFIFQLVKQFYTSVFLIASRS